MMISAIPGEWEAQSLPAKMHILPEMSFDTCPECGREILLIDLQSCRPLETAGFYETGCGLAFFIKEAGAKAPCFHPKMEVVHDDED